MHLSFSSPSLRSLCESKAKAVKVLGAGASSTLRAWLSDLVAATTVQEFVLPHRLSRQEIVVPLSESHQMVLVSAHSKVPLDVSGDVAWFKVTRLKVAEIGLAHE